MFLDQSLLNYLAQKVFVLLLINHYLVKNERLRLIQIRLVFLLILMFCYRKGELNHLLLSNIINKISK